MSTDKITLTNDDNISGTATTFTLDNTAASTTYYSEVNISNVNAESTITLETSAKRAVVWGINYEKGTTRTLSSISLSGQKTEFYVGDAFSFKGTVTASYEENDVENADVTSSTNFSGYNMSSVGQQTVTASYTEGSVTKTAQYTIHVKEKQAYSVTYSQPENGTLTVVDGNGITITSGSKILYGEHVIATATPSQGYKFRSLQFTDATTHTFTASNTKDWTMGNHEITIEANFDLIPTYTVAWSVNGKIVKSETVEEDTEVTAPEVESINGKDFIGWVTTPTIESDVEPARVTPSPTAKGTITYYAAFANIEGQAERWVKVVPSSTGSLEAGVYALISPDGHAFNGSITTGNSQHGEQTTGIFTFVDGVANSAPEGVCELTLAVVTDGYTLYNSTYGYLYASSASSGNLNWHATENSYWSVGVYSNSQGSQDQWRYKLSNSTPQLRYYNNMFRTYGTGTNNGDMVNLAKKVPGNAVYSNYTTLPNGATFSVSAGGKDDATDAYYATYYTDHKVTVPTGCQAATVNVVDNKMYLSYTWSERDVIPANTGVVIKANAAGTYTYAIATGEAKAVEGTNYLTGLTAAGTTVAPEAGDYKFYKLANGDNGIGFYYGADGGAAFNTGANKAYLAVPADVAAQVKGFAFGEADEATAIFEIVNENNAAKTIYNLNGQRVSKAQKGIYIVNGKKVMFK